MVKPRTAGTREMRVAAATVNFMVSFWGESTGGMWSSWSRTEKDEFNVHSTWANYFKPRLISDQNTRMRPRIVQE